MKETTMNINKEEQQFIAENITRYDVVTDITVDDIEIRIHGKAHGGTGSTALYRIADVADIYAHVEGKCKEAKVARPAPLRDNRAKVKLWHRDSKGWMKNTEAGRE